MVYHFVGFGSAAPELFRAARGMSFGAAGNSATGQRKAYRGQGAARASLSVEIPRGNGLPDEFIQAVWASWTFLFRAQSERPPLARQLPTGRTNKDSVPSPCRCWHTETAAGDQAAQTEACIRGIPDGKTAHMRDVPSGIAEDPSAAARLPCLPSVGDGEQKSTYGRPTAAKLNGAEDHIPALNRCHTRRPGER